MSVIKSVVAVTLAITFASPALASAGFVALEGSDATSFHRDASYTPQLFKYLQGSSSKSVLVFNSGGSVSDLSAITGGVATTNVTSLAGVTLSNYSAIYLQTPGNCCSADVNALNGYGSSVNAFIAAGGNISIGNYIGGGYDGVVVGGSATPAGMIQGYMAMNGGVGFGSSCTDGEVVTALGTAKGFSQPPVDGCWSHQGYSNSYWGALGYVNLISSSPTEFGYADGTGNGSSFLARGGTLGSSGTPEPETWALMLVGFSFVGATLRRRVATSVAA